MRLAITILLTLALVGCKTVPVKKEPVRPAPRPTIEETEYGVATCVPCIALRQDEVPR